MEPSDAINYRDTSLTEYERIIDLIMEEQNVNEKEAQRRYEARPGLYLDLYDIREKDEDDERY